MAEWKKLVTSGSNISQLNNDAGYLTSATIPSKNAFASSSINGTVLIADSPSGSLNFASSSGQGLTISGNSGTDTLTWGLAAIPNSSLLNSGSIIGNTPVNLGTTVTSIDGLTLTSAVVSGSLFGTASYASQALTASYANVANSASYATSASQAITASFALSAPTAATASFITASNVFGPYGSNSIISASQAVTATSASQATTASFALTATSSSYANNATTASYALTATSSSYANNATSASYALTASFALNANSDLAIAGDTGTGTVDLQTQTLIVSGTASEIETSVSGQTITIGLPNNVTIAGDLAVNGGDITTTALTASLFNSTATQINIGASALQMRIGNAAGTITIPGNLTVQGTTTSISSSVLEIADQFIVLASGSNVDVDGGIIIQDASDGSGHAFGYGTPENRWVLQSSLNHLSTSFSAIDGYINTTQYGLLSAIPANPSYGGATYGYGNMYTATDTSEIYIWA
jgi:phage baseplate assembly protein gpV